MSLKKKKQKNWNSVSGYILSTFLFWKPTSIDSKDRGVSPQSWFQAGIVCDIKATHLCPAYSLTTPWIITHQAPLSVGFPRQEYWSGLPFPSPGDLLNPETEPTSPPLACRFFTSEPPGKLLNLHIHLHRRGFECSSNSVIFSSVYWRAGDALFQLLPSSQLNKKHISMRSFVFFGEIRNGTQMPVFPHSHPTLAFLPFMFSHVLMGLLEGEIHKLRTTGEILWQSSGYDSTLSLLRVQVQSLVKELQFCEPCGMAKKYRKKEPLGWGFIFHETIYIYIYIYFLYY